MIDARCLQSALELAGRGWPVFPIHAPDTLTGRCSCGAANCADIGKHPRVSGGFKSASTDPTVIRAWFSKWPDANLAVSTGVAAGVWALDSDPRHGGDRTLAELETANGPLPPTVTAVTGSDGRHRYFRAPVDAPMPRCRIGFRAGLDVRAEGGYVLVPPSRHKCGASYGWLAGCAPGEIAVADAPNWLLQLVGAQPSQERTIIDPPIDDSLRRRARAYINSVPGVGEGSRNVNAFKLSGHLRALRGHSGEQLSEAEIEALTLSWNKRCTPPLPEKEVKKCVESSRVNGTPPPEKPAERQPRRAGQPPPKPHAPTPEVPKPSVLVPGTHNTGDAAYEVSDDDFATTVLDALPGGTSYVRGDVPGQLLGEPGSRRFRALDLDRTRIVCDRHLRLCKWVKTKDENGQHIQACVFIPSKTDHAKLILGRAIDHPSVPALLRMTRCPSFVGPTFARAQPGFNWDSGLFYDEHPSLRGLTTIRDKQLISETIAELLIDFPFQAESDRQNFIGLLICLIVRSALSGNVPLHLVVSCIERSGKTKLVEQVAGHVILGEAIPALSLSSNDDEREKRVLSVLIESAPCVHLDNLPPQLNSAVLASLITAEWFQGRLLGFNRTARVRNDLVLIGSGNNVRASSELAKRVVPIRLLPKTSRPEERSDFAHPDLPTYVRQVRPRALGALLGMVENWIDAGRPLGRMPLGGFESYAATVGGILAVQGYDDFLANRMEWVADADTHGADLEQFVQAWWDAHSGNAVQPRALFDLARRLDIFPEYVAAPREHAARSIFGRSVLLAATQRPVLGKRIMCAGSGTSRRYRLVPLEEARP